MVTASHARLATPSTSVVTKRVVLGRGRLGSGRWTSGGCGGLKAVRFDQVAASSAERMVYG